MIKVVFMYTQVMRPYFISIALLSGMLILTPLTTAQADNDYMEARRLQDAGEILSLQSILEHIKPSFPGKILEVELEKKEKKIVYEVEILGDDGVVRELTINARNGKLLSVKKED